MKNSVASRTNAQSSCAAHFVREHFLVPTKNAAASPAWAHVDMAYPAHKGERATGFGVGLIAKVLGLF